MFSSIVLILFTDLNRSAWLYPDARTLFYLRFLEELLRLNEPLLEPYLFLFTDKDLYEEFPAIPFVKLLLRYKGPFYRGNFYYICLGMTFYIMWGWLDICFLLQTGQRPLLILLLAIFYRWLFRTEWSLLTPPLNDGSLTGENYYALP